ncbi:hypothetical protein PISL3812_03536 [Talaromyces islandicus]|uniref:Uncharacterized protein n=1 Tax=Talaromyces islandicus TaxID=28573 RepID=A0A0U1LT04_TALIS|nr:hypothetical protein PISL3812_03536 [Talaromyces islandicus]
MTTYQKQPASFTAADSQPTHQPWQDKMDYIYDADTEGQPDKYNINLRIALSRPEKPLEERLTDISLEELGAMLTFIYYNQDYNGSLASHPRFLRRYVSPEDMFEPGNVEEANSLLHEFVSTHIEILFTAEEQLYTLGPIYRDEDDKKQFLIVWYGLREPLLPAVLANSPYIAYTAHWYLPELKTDLDFSWMDG